MIPLFSGLPVKVVATPLLMGEVVAALRTRMTT